MDFTNGNSSSKKILNGTISPGYQTPGTAFGAEFVLELPGVTREDIE